MEECTDFRFVATELIARDTFVFVWVVKTFDSGVALAAFETLWTLIPADAFGQHEAVFWRILENFWWSSEVSQVVGVDTTFTVVAFLLRGTPSSLVHEHVKHEPILI